MPRSFLVKKYLKQKYDADFKLQQTLGNQVSDPAGSPTLERPEITAPESQDSDKAVTPFTPAVTQSLPVNLKNGKASFESHNATIVPAVCVSFC